MRYMFDQKLNVAYTESDKICKLLNYRSDGMISTQEIVDVVKKYCCPNIDINFVPFNDIGVRNDYGAVMRTRLGSNNNVTEARILINSSKDPKFQRFSLVHELGHLVTRTWTLPTQPAEESESPNYTISTHINYNVTNIKPEDYSRDGYLLKEQIANIFALRVLMPSRQYYEKLKTIGDIAEISQFFGLTEDAVVSRAQIGA